MKKFNQKIFLSAMFVLLTSPLLVSAVWWNPLSWFNKDNQTEQIEQVNPIVNEEAEVNESRVPDEDLSPEQEIVEEVVTQVIKVNNPELQARIDALVRENYELNSKINSYISKLNECKAQISAAPTTLAESTKEEKLAEIDGQILDVINRYLSVTDSETIVFNDKTHEEYNRESFLLINQLLNSYRVVDVTMSHDNLPTKDVETLKEGREYVLDLKNYLINSYIRYR